MTENKGSLFSDRRYAFSAGGLAPDTFEVVRFEGEEALSALYRFDLLLASRDSDIDERVLLGQLAQFSLNDGVEGGRPTVYRGLLRSFAYQYQISGWTFYRATLAPKMWLLDTFYLSEVYLDMDRHEIFTTVMQNAGFLFDDFDLRFQKGSAAYSKRDYICQYRESYLSFIARWAERLGIYWWYEESDGREKIIFSDTRMAHKDEGLLLNYQDAGELDAAMGRKRRLQSLELEACNLPKKIVVRDYSAQRASMEIMGTAAVDPHGNGEEHIFGEHLKSNGEAAHIAKLRAEGVLARGNIYRGGTTATGARCGGFIEVQGHPRKRFDRRYLVVSVKHRGSQAGLLLEGLKIPARGETGGSADFYQAEISAIPSEVQFRPEITHLWPKIEGTLNGFVDAEGSGQYAELNEKGEYKIQVPFDVTHKNAQRGSAWIRMATPYAGSDHGMHFPLHKGTEVVLSFINGDPDQPIILGAIPNSINPNVVRNENQMQSRIRTAGGNEIVMHDEAGKQHLELSSPIGNTSIRIGSASGSSSVSGAGSYAQQQAALLPTARIQRHKTKQMWQGALQWNQLSGSQQMQQGWLDSVWSNLSSFQPSSGDGGVTINTAGSAKITCLDYANIVGGEYLSLIVGNKNEAVLGPVESFYVYKYEYVFFKTDVWSGSKTETGAGAKSEVLVGTKNELVTGAKTETIIGDKTESVAGIKTSKVLVKNDIVTFAKLSEYDTAVNNIKTKLSESDLALENLTTNFMNGDVTIENTQTYVAKREAYIAEKQAYIQKCSAFASFGTSIYMPE
ncbi:type VI secretion system Vgr family protein [Candidatus Methylospira mobilis]|nr:type VI secretion system tip protein TssI/VgrG [Candidatus Methylospira mobilis]